jgi:hypothetical protein
MPNRPVLEGGPHDFDPNPPSGGGGTTPKGTTGGSPGLLTSTGGLFGLFPVLMIPAFDAKTRIGSIYTYDVEDFDCEKDAIYKFKVEELTVGRNVTVKKIILIYRNIGECTINVGVEAYSTLKEIKKRYIQVSRKLKIGFSPADKKLYTKEVDLVITGERPQGFVIHKAHSGPFSGVSFTMIGKMQEENKL